MTLDGLASRVAAKQAQLAVVGLGYVGLPAACLFAAAGLRVTGIDRKAERVAAIREGVCPIEGDEPELPSLLARVVREGALTVTTDLSAVASADVIIVAVETPVEADHAPRYGALEAVMRGIGPHLATGALVIVESTVSPGTCRDQVARWLSLASGGELGARFHLGHCPERVMPGRLVLNMREMARVCGGSSPAVSEVMRGLYRHVVSADLDAADLTTAEIVKTSENAYRDVQIAFANELARVCEDAGAEFLAVRALVNKSPGRNVLLAGAGVGGHCIPKDPWLLRRGARSPLPLVEAARAVNDAMPAHVGELLAEALSAAGGSLAGSRIAVLGYAYLEGSDDDRNSPTEALLAWLEAHGATARTHDPFVAGRERDLSSVIEGTDAMVIMVAHAPYRALDLAALGKTMRRRVVVDGRHVVDPSSAQSAGFVFRGIGRPRA